MNLPLFLAAADGFSRAVFEDWHSTVPLVAFQLTFVAFIYFTIRALRISPKERERLAALPLDNEHGDDTQSPPAA
ncbi:MAG: hypothetical protein SFY80_15280 [Verrucomicrobiota bacterium]|nr:hypothetical protein [Verrucomicrobiota bacterium]